PWEVFRDQFIQDASAEEARSVWERLVPQPFQPWDARLDLAEFHRGGLPRSYIAGSDDRALPQGAWHPAMSRRPGPVQPVERRGRRGVGCAGAAELARKLVETSND